MVEVGLFFFYILLPILKLVGLQNGISNKEIAVIIGNHFPEVSDKLLNLIQLNELVNDSNSELLVASIEQRSKELRPIPFLKAIDFSNNTKYVKYTLIPIVIYLLFYITGHSNIFNDSYKRVVDYSTEYVPPAPFYFSNNSVLTVVQGDSFKLEIETIGDTYPSDVMIQYNDQEYFMKATGVNTFEYDFTNVQESIQFYVSGGGVVSKSFYLECLKTPTITNLKLVLNYPSYLQKENQIVLNTGNTIIPEGTTITWQVDTYQTDSVLFRVAETSKAFTKSTSNYFTFTKTIANSFNYILSTSNNDIKNYENIPFKITTIKDQYPEIQVFTNIDSLTYGEAVFYGNVSDDYKVSKLQLVYYPVNNTNLKLNKPIAINNSSFSEFEFNFPGDLDIDDQTNYEMFLEVYDNDAFNGSKKTTSKVFSYYKPSEIELKEQILNEQKESISEFDELLKETDNTTKELEDFILEQKNENSLKWNDNKMIEEFLDRQKNYQEMFQEQTKQLQEQVLNEEVSPDNEQTKEMLLQRFQEAKEAQKNEKLLKELNELSSKLDKENLFNKLEELTKKNQQNKRNLERLLELTKRFYVEQKRTQLSSKLQELAQKQDQNINENDSELAKQQQENIHNEFTKIQQESNDLEKLNDELLRPMDLKLNKESLEDINEDLQKADDALSKKQDPKSHQKNASKKMKSLSKEVSESMMQMSGQELDENIDDLRKIVENLIEFSFQQEDLTSEFISIDNNNPTYPNQLKRQNVLKEYFSHIDDSLYVLSLRLMQLGKEIQDDVNKTHYYLDEAINAYAESNLTLGESNAQYVMTHANNLANNLSNVLESLMNASPSFGKGNGSKNEFSLPDIIQKQQELSNEIQNKLEGKSENENGSPQMNEPLSEQMYEAYKKQAELREALEKILSNSPSKEGNDANKQMEELENELLNKGFTQEYILQSKQLQYQLLKFQESLKQQGLDNQRNSRSSFLENNLKPANLNFEDVQKKNRELLKRQLLPLRQLYKIKVQEYFKNSTLNDTIQLRN